MVLVGEVVTAAVALVGLVAAVVTALRTEHYLPGMQTLQQLCEVSHDAPFGDQETERRTLGHATGGASPSLGAAFPVSPHIPLTL